MNTSIDMARPRMSEAQTRLSQAKDIADKAVALGNKYPTEETLSLANESIELHSARLGEFRDAVGDFKIEFDKRYGG